MTAPFRLYGAELSPYSVKVRSYLRSTQGATPNVKAYFGAKHVKYAA